MSENSQGEEELQALLAGKSALARSYRESSNEQPPAKVDAAVLAASRWAVGADLPSSGARALDSPHAIAPRGRKSFLDWGVPLATAAVVVVAVSLVYTIERDPAITEIYEKYDREVLATLGVEPESVVSEGTSQQEESAVPESLPVPAPVSPAVPNVSEPATVVDAPEAAVVPKVVASPQTPAVKTAPAPKRAVIAQQSQAKEEAVLKEKLLKQREIAERKRRQQSESLAAERSVMEADEGSAVPLLAEQQLSGVVAANATAEDAEAEPESGRVDEPGDLPEEQRMESAERDVVEPISEIPFEATGTGARQELPAPSLDTEQTMSDELVVKDSQGSSAEVVRDPDDWIQEIEKLLSDGRRDEAIQSLRKFRVEYPDFSVPDNLHSLESTDAE